MELTEILQLIQLPLVLAIPLIAMGLLLAFFGRLIFYYLIFILGGIIIGGALAFLFYVGNQQVTTVAAVGLVGFLGGGLAAIFAFRFILFVIGGSVGFLAGILIFPDNIYAIGILFAAGGFLLIILFDAALAIATAIEGGSLIGLTLLLSGGGFNLSAVVALVIILLGAVFQLFGPFKNKPSQKRLIRNRQTKAKAPEKSESKEDVEFDFKPDYKPSYIDIARALL